MKSITIQAEGGGYRIRKVSADGAESFNTTTVTCDGIGDIHLGTVVNVARNAQGAFVDFGGEDEGFLPAHNVLPCYGKARVRGRRADIQSLLEPGQTVLVQLNEDRSNAKGFVLTTQISLASPYIVIMHGNPSRAVSKKIGDDLERERLLGIVDSLKPPTDLGYVLRTNAERSEPATLRRELSYLLSLWKDLAGNIKESAAPSLVYRDVESVVRTLGRWIDSDVSRIDTDDALLRRQLKPYLAYRYPDTEIALGELADTAVAV